MSKAKPLSPSLVNEIYSAAQDRDIRISRRQLETILADTEPEKIKAWVEGTLRSKDLLTKDEVKLWNHILSTPSLAKQYAHPNGGPSNSNIRDIDFLATPAFTESDYGAAIKTIEASTKDIERQIKVLETQQKALSKLIQYENATERQARREREKVERRKALERQNLDFRISDLSTSLTSTLQTHQSTTVPTKVRTAQDLVTKMLREDDRVFEALNDLLLTGRTADRNEDEEAKGSGSDSQKTAEPDETVEVEAELSRVDKLCSLLTSLVRQEITARLDVTYMQHSYPSHSSSSSPTAVPLSSNSDDPSLNLTPEAEKETEAEVEAEQDILTDLNSLHTDIPTVSDLYVTSSFREPLRDAIKRRETNRRRAEKRSEEDIATCIESMTNRLQELVCRVEGLVGVRQSLERIDAELLLANSPAEGDTNVKTGHTTNADTNQNHGLDKLLSYLGLPAFTSGSAGVDKQNLEKALRSKLYKTHHSISSTQQHIYDPLKDQLASVAGAGRVLAQTLENAERETEGGEGMKELVEKRLAEVGSGIEELTSSSSFISIHEGGASAEARRARERFVGRWGSS